MKLYQINHFDDKLLYDGEYYCWHLLKGKNYKNGKLKFDGDFMCGYYEYRGKKYEKGKLIFEGELHVDDYWTGKKYLENSEFEGEYLFIWKKNWKMERI